MSISGIGSRRSALGVQTLVEMRRQLDELQRQLGDRQEIGHLCRPRARSRTCGRPAQPALRRSRRFENSITTSMCASTSRRPRSAGSPTSGATVKSAAFQSQPSSTATGRPSRRSTAYASLNEMLGLLNTQAGDRYHLLGPRSRQPSVETPRSHHERRRRPRRLQAGRVGAQTGGSRHARSRPHRDHGADRDVGAGGGGNAGHGVRLQARPASTRHWPIPP